MPDNPLQSKGPEEFADAALNEAEDTPSLLLSRGIDAGYGDGGDTVRKVAISDRPANHQDTWDPSF